MADLSREYRIRTENFDKKMRFVRSTYRDGSLRLTLYEHTFDNEGYHWYEPYIDFTCDLNRSLSNPYLASVNPGFGDMIYDWMARKGIGYTTDTEIFTGLYFMELVEFDHKFIDRLTKFDGEYLPPELKVKSKNASMGFVYVETW